MNIALVGAPGSGKTKLAKQLSPHLEECFIVDDYVKEVEEETDLAIGPLVGYVSNMAVILGRYGRENVARSKHKNVITCGTMFESSIYYVAHVTAFREASTEEEMALYAPRVDASLRMMACFYNDLMPYDHIFYLRLGDSVSEDAKFIDQQLQVAAGGFKLKNMIHLDIEEDPNCECRLKRVLAVINGEVQEA